MQSSQASDYDSPLSAAVTPRNRRARSLSDTESDAATPVATPTDSPSVRPRLTLLVFQLTYISVTVNLALN